MPVQPWERHPVHTGVPVALLCCLSTLFECFSFIERASLQFHIFPFFCLMLIVRLFNSFPHALLTLFLWNEQSPLTKPCPSIGCPSGWSQDRRCRGARVGTSRKSFLQDQFAHRKNTVPLGRAPSDHAAPLGSAHRDVVEPGAACLLPAVGTGCCSRLVLFPTCQAGHLSEGSLTGL